MTGIDGLSGIKAISVRLNLQWMEEAAKKMKMAMHGGTKGFLGQKETS